MIVEHSIARLLAITPPAVVAPMIDTAIVDAWIRGGATALGIAVLLREPRAELGAILAAPRFAALRLALAEHGIPALISVAPEALEDHAAEHVLAARPALAGVQLRGDPTPTQIRRWRERLPDHVIGRSCHGQNPQLAPEVDYTCLAPVFSPRTVERGLSKPAIGLAALRRWTAIVPRVFALGGVDSSTAGPCLAAGAEGLAGISLFFGQTAAAQQTVAGLRQAFADHVPQARRR